MGDSEGGNEGEMGDGSDRSRTGGESEDAKKLLDTFKSSMEGLDEDEVRRRLEEYGRNELEHKKKNMLIKYFSYLNNPLSWTMGFAALLAVIMVDWLDMILVLSLLIGNTTLAFYEETSSENAVESLQSQLVASVGCVRAGVYRNDVESASLVPGDIVCLKLGNVVPADCYLMDYDDSEVKIDESSLTGESKLVKKKKCDVIYSGSIVKKGEFRALVFATGKKTFYGKIASMIEATGRVISHVQKVLQTITWFCIGFIVVGVILELTIQFGYRHKPCHSLKDCNTINNCLVIIIGGLPIAMPTVLSVMMALGAIDLAREKAIVVRMTAIEEIAGMQILCSDKTGTLTLNELKVKSPEIFVKSFSKQDVIMYASLVSGSKDKDAIDKALLNACSEQVKENLTKHSIIKYRPFDPSTKWTYVKFNKQGDNVAYAAKGAPKVILNLSNNRNRIRKIVDRKVMKMARGGYRAIGVAVSNSLIASRILNDNRIDGDDDVNNSSGMNTSSMNSSNDSSNSSVMNSSNDSSNSSVMNSSNSSVMNSGSGVSNGTINDTNNDNNNNSGIVTNINHNGNNNNDNNNVNDTNDTTNVNNNDTTNNNTIDNSNDTTKDNNVDWMMIGLIPMFDPPRHDTKSTIENTKNLGVNVKMITGDQLEIAVETCKMLGMGTKVLSAKTLNKDETQIQNKFSCSKSELVFFSDGFAHVLPEDKFSIVQILQERKIIVGMTGDGVNDAAALKKADIGIAVAGSSDAARSAADIVLVASGLSVIVRAIRTSRKIFNRMRSYVMYSITSCVRLVLTFLLLTLIFDYYFPTIAVVFFSLINDCTMIVFTKDRSEVSPEPEVWNLPAIFAFSTTLGIYLATSTLIFYLLINHSGMWQAFGLIEIDSSHQSGVIYLQVSLTNLSMVFYTRTRSFSFLNRPSYYLIITFVFAQVVASVLGAYGLGGYEEAQVKFSGGRWGWVLATWIYSIIWIIPVDFLKYALNYAIRVFSGNRPDVNKFKDSSETKINLNTDNTSSN